MSEEKEPESIKPEGNSLGQILGLLLVLFGPLIYSKADVYINRYFVSRLEYRNKHFISCVDICITNTMQLTDILKDKNYIDESVHGAIKETITNVCNKDCDLRIQ